MRFHVVEPMAQFEHIQAIMENTTSLTGLSVETLETLFAGTTASEELRVWQSLRAAMMEAPDATQAQVTEYIRATVAHVKAWRGTHR